MKLLIEFMDGGPARIWRCQEPLTAEFAVDAIMDIIEPPTEGFGRTNDEICQRLDLHIVVERGATVLTGQNIF